MATAPTFKPPRKKFNVLWLLGGAFLLLIGLFFLQLLGPNPPIVVSPQTTYITEPLGPDGLPDFEQYVLKADREGVTPSNNAAVLLWQALWPGELSPKDYAPMAAELGLAQIPSAKEALDSPLGKVTHGKLEAWLKSIGQINDGSDSEQMVDHVRVRIIAQPWTSEQVPPMATWIAENQKPLDLIVAASRRPKYYSPSPTFLDNKGDMFISVLLPHIGGIRDAARSLSTRAMWNLGEGLPMEAWPDVLAIYRLSRLLTQSRTLVEQLVGIALDGMANSAAQTVLESRELTAEQIKQIRQDLEQLPPMAGVARSLDQGERLFVVDALVQIGARGHGGMMEELGAPNDGMSGALDVISVDWNLVLRETNGWYDRLVAAARISDRAERDAAIKKLEGDIDRLVGQSRSGSRIAAAAFSRQQRSEVVSGMMLGLFFPAVSRAIEMEDKQNVTLELTRLAAALAQFRAENGAYPEKLDELVPGVLSNVPNDPYSGKPLMYSREGEGFLLQSVGPKGVDGPAVRAPRPRFELPRRHD
jgi:hypothetical protein